MKIRLKKINKYKRTIYHIVITAPQKPVARGFIEKIGTFTPKEDKWSNKYVFINEDRLFHWICKGAVLEPSLIATLLGPLFRLPKYI